MMLLGTGRYTGAMLAIVALTVMVNGAAWGAGADSLEEARITERMTVEDFEETETPQERMVPDTWEEQLEGATGDPNPWLQKRVQGFAVGLGNTMFALADAAAVWGYHNRGWISPRWVSGIGQAVMASAVIGLIAYSLRDIRDVYSRTQ